MESDSQNNLQNFNKGKRLLKYIYDKVKNYTSDNVTTKLYLECYAQRISKP